MVCQLIMEKKRIYISLSIVGNSSQQRCLAYHISSHTLVQFLILLVRQVTIAGVVICVMLCHIWRGLYFNDHVTSLTELLIQDSKTCLVRRLFFVIILITAFS